MKKIILSMALIVTLMTQLSANAFNWNGFFKWLLFGYETETVSTENLDKLYTSTTKTIKTTDESVQKSFVSIVSILSTADEAKKVSNNIKAINNEKITDTEKNKKILKIYSDYTTTLQNNKVGLLLIMKTLSDSDKTNFAKHLDTLSKCVQTYNEQYQALTKVKTTSQEDVVKNITALSTEVKNKSNTIGSLSLQLNLMAKIAGIK
jgi:uncharacterized protein Yka (UPF0111/DUF47 family)